MSERPLTVPEAAEELGVAPERVGALIRAGELAAERARGVWLVDRDAVARRGLLTELGVTAASVRPWTPRIAWAALRSIDGDDTLLGDLGRREGVRLQARIEGASAGRLLSAVRNRATTVRVSIHPSRVDRLRALTVPSGLAGAGRHGHGLSGDAHLDGYLTATALDRARDDLGVRITPTGSHLLRVVADVDSIQGLEVAPRLAVAADLVDHAVEDGRTEVRIVEVIRRLLSDLGRPAAPLRPAT